ncbi:disease resistance protein L6-like [Syzygium oleosum]|uniref:disease resistance protein L6-like n=1 Tax=Syzygium oleosum TaxID=219896 RepID=UPI0024B9CDE3|nr:disease resistance protein L6-like [Syzygium oleosum]
MHRLVIRNYIAALVAPILLSVLAYKLLDKRRASAHRKAEDPNPGAPALLILPIQSHYDVFLSFRGTDTRRAFADLLYCCLVDAGVHVFRDDGELRPGEDIGLEFVEDIKNSKILIPIISANYAASKWCLDVLVQMMECKRRLLPIFYKVERAAVQHQVGSFGEAFRYYCNWRRFDQRVVEEWKQALEEVSLLQGWESEKDADGYFIL